MMTRRQYYLLKLIEECQEVSQRAAKSMQFGKDQTQAGDGQSLSARKAEPEHFLTNVERLSGELNDLLAVATVLEGMGELDADIFLSEVGKERKITKIAKYLKLSQTLGEVEHD
jgi:NTP pyrophosphatase (non-canonical NTP hydrolase)